MMPTLPAQEEINGGLGDEAYDYEWDGEVTGLVPYFGPSWDDLHEGERAGCVAGPLTPQPASQPARPLAGLLIVCHVTLTGWRLCRGGLGRHDDAGSARDA